MLAGNVLFSTIKCSIIRLDGGGVEAKKRVANPQKPQKLNIYNCYRIFKSFAKERSLQIVIKTFFTSTLHETSIFSCGVDMLLCLPIQQRNSCPCMVYTTL